MTTTRDPPSTDKRVARWTDHGASGVMPPVEVVAATDYDDLNRLATAFYKRVSARVPGLLEQIEDVARPLRRALGMED